MHSAKLRRWSSDTDGAGYTYWCQGCNLRHRVRTEGPDEVWGFNGNLERPTFTPSVLTTWDSLSPAAQEKSRSFFAEHGRYPDNKELPFDVHHICHTFVVDGRVQFLTDCTHALAGQTLDLPDLPILKGHHRQ